MKKITLLLSLILGCLLNISVSAAPFFYEQTFDNPDDFPDDAPLPEGWANDESDQFMRYPAMWCGTSAPSGDYILCAMPANDKRDDAFFTHGFRLKGGVVCKVRFSYWAMNGTPPTMRTNTFSVYAGTSQSSDGMVLIGETDPTVANQWNTKEVSFTPDEDGVYYFCFRLKASMAQSGLAALDSIEIEGEAYEEKPAVIELTSLDAFYGSEIAADKTYIFKGEALVTYVGKDIMYIEDGTAGVAVTPPDVTKFNIGDILTDVEGTVSVVGGTPTILPAEGKDATIVSSGNEVTAAAVSLEDLVAAQGAGYTARLVNVAKLSFKNVEAGDVFEEDVTYSLTDGTNDAGFRLFAESDLTDTAIPTEEFNLTGIMTGDGGVTISPRSKSDIEIIEAPIPQVVVSLPYMQSFDNVDDDYDGTSYLPKGWLTTGTIPFVTASMPSLPAVTGSYYMVTPESDVMRDESAYTPFFEMTAGTTYTISFYLNMPGDVLYDQLREMKLSFTAGKAQSRDAQTETLFVADKATSDNWEKCETTFTPEADGTYCFAFNITSDVEYTGHCAVDDLFVTAPGMVLRPTADFAYDGWFDIMDSRYVAFGDNPVKMKNCSKYGTEFAWEVKGAIPETSTEENPEFIFPDEGVYSIKLTAKNQTGERTTYKSIDLKKFSGEEENAGYKTYSDSETIVTGSWSIPTFDTDPTYDFVTGPNHYYRKFAERFELPSNINWTIKSISTFLSAYSRKMEYSEDMRNHPFTIAFYGETDGRLDESKLFGKKVSTVVDEFGSMGIGLEHSKMFGFMLEENPITVNGPFYLAFEFSDNMPIDSDDPMIERSYVALSVVKHKSEETTIYAKPTAGPEGFVPDGEWHKVDELSHAMKGYGTNLILWGDMTDIYAGTVAIDNNGDVIFAIRFDGETLDISGTEAGETIMIHDVAGRLVKKATADEYGTTVQLGGIPEGVYVVTTKAGSRKFFK